MLDVRKVEGFSMLPQDVQEDFLRTYSKHMKYSSSKEREKYELKRVSAGKGYVRAEFVNGSWLHYSHGVWY